MGGLAAQTKPNEHRRSGIWGVSEHRERGDVLPPLPSHRFPMRLQTPLGRGVLGMMKNESLN